MQGCFAFLQLNKLYGRIKSRNKTGIEDQTQIQDLPSQFKVFISHHGLDTRQNLGVLLHNNLMQHKIHSFLDCKSMKPGDKLFERIDSAICECKIGVILFSPRYCESHYCLHELALLVETKKKLIPIFCNVDVDQLQIIDDRVRTYDSKDVERFRYALEEAKNSVGIRFNTS